MKNEFNCEILRSDQSHNFSQELDPSLCTPEKRKISNFKKPGTIETTLIETLEKDQDSDSEDEEEEEEEEKNETEKKSDKGGLILEIILKLVPSTKIVQNRCS